MDIIRILRESGNKVLQTEAKDLQIWGKLKHNKEDLELFLCHNLAQIEFKTKNNSKTAIICSSNTPLIQILQAKKSKDKKKLRFLKSQGIHTNDTLSVNTWDLIENKLKTISLKEWQIINFISINEENILVLDSILSNILKKT